MKKKYTRPVMEMEEFTPNEYVATCGTIEIPGGGYKKVKFGAGKFETSYKGQFDEVEGFETFTIWDGSVMFEDGSVDSTIYGYMGDPYGPYPPGYNFEQNQIDRCEREKAAEWQGEPSYWAYHYHVYGETNNHS